MAERRFDRPRLAVVKVGSSSLRGPDGRLDRDQIRVVVDGIAAARASATDVVLVSSGAVAAGLVLLAFDQRPTDMAKLQSAASVGQGALIHAYQRDFARHGLVCGQVLLTQDDFVSRRRYLNARKTFRMLLDLGAVPVVNENDVVATDELAYGDNDHLAALVASMLEADLLLLLSDVGGLYEVDPRQTPDANLVDRVDDLDRLAQLRIGGTGSFVGSGGMRSKVEAARVAVLSACHAVVADARRPAVIPDVLAGEPIGTWFVAQPKRLEARRLWIGFALNTRGRVHVDAGAARALVRRGTSLLAVGVTGADGDFTSGDAVAIVDPTGTLIARGLVNYDASDLRRIAGRTTEDAAAAFGDAYGREVVHRDDLVVLVS
ncbi:MAG: glutamate 5-kinase [Actinobacteria bacterium]|nr:glutamate 5-kinase [Actinomycetota bacterium]